MTDAILHKRNEYNIEIDGFKTACLNVESTNVDINSSLLIPKDNSSERTF